MSNKRQVIPPAGQTYSLPENDRQVILSLAANSSSLMKYTSTERIIELRSNIEKSCSCMQVTHHFDAPKHRPFHGWAGVVTEWPAGGAPIVDFGKWKSNATGGTVTFDCQPFQLCMYGANSKEMNSRDKFTHFAFAGLSAGGAFRLQNLPKDADARDVFAAGGWTPPDIEDMVDKINHIPLDGRFETDFYDLMLECTKGFGMSPWCRPNEQKFFNILTCWPILMPIHAAFLAQREKRTRLDEEKHAAKLEARKARLEKV